MPYRKPPLVTGEIYHACNRSIAGIPIFHTPTDYHRILNVADFYQYQKLPLRYSFYKLLSADLKRKFVEEFMVIGNVGLEILAYCLMPNHMHFLLKQLDKNGVSNFMRNIQHSYSKYYNTKQKRTGALFQSMFKAVRIASDEQLIHVSRYIHLNPATAYIIETNALLDYPWSSLQSYVTDREANIRINKDQVLCQFKNTDAYRRFVFDQADYQRQLALIKHLTLED